MKLYFLLVSCIISLSLKGQVIPVFTEADTLKFGYFSAGSLDSVDVKTSSQFTNLPRGGFGTNSLITPSFLFAAKNLQGMNQSQVIQDLKFTALPHLGFNYAFGSKGTQTLNVDYEQAFSKNTLLNFILKQNSSQGVLKNGAFSFRNFQGSFRKNGTFYSTRLDVVSTSESANLNGGVFNDSTILSQGIEFVQVYKNGADSCYRKVKKWTFNVSNYFDFVKDSSKAFGLTTQHALKINNQVYRERYKSATEYLHNYYDTLGAKDQFQLSTLQNGGGIFLKTKYIYIDGLVNHTYWKTQNKGIHHDTTEINLSSKLKIPFKKFNLSNDFNFNLIGAKNEWHNYSTLGVTWKKIAINLNLKAEQKLPIPFLRNYFANNYKIHLEKLHLQSALNIGATADYSVSEKLKVGLEVNSTSLLNSYFFVDSLWRNDTLTAISISSIEGHASYTLFNHFTFQPRYCLTVTSSNFKKSPQSTFAIRMFYKTKAFKAKKLDFIAGTELSYVSDYTLMGYNRPMDVLLINNTVKTFEAMWNANLFIGIGIKEVRMYAKVSNVGYFWNNRLNQQLIGYPIQKNLIQIGITWDFFN